MGNPRRGYELRLLDQMDKIRLVLVGILLVLARTAPAGNAGSHRVAGLAVSFAAVYALFTHLVIDWRAIRREGHVHLMAALLVCADILCISFFLWAIGGGVGALTSLLLIEVVFAAAFFMGLELAFVLATVCGANIILGLSATAPVSAWHIAAGCAATIVVGWLAYVLAEVARRELAVTSRIVRNLTEGVMLIADRGKLTVVNPRIEHMLGVDAGSLVGLNVFDPANSDALGPVADLLRDVINPPHQEDNVTARYCHIEDPTPLEVQCVTAACLGDRGEPIAWVVVCKDVTDVLDAVRIREEGIAMLAHELRGRLSSIRATTEVLLQMADSLTPETRTRTVELMDRATRRLSSLADRTLEAVAVGHESAVFEFQAVALADVAQGCIDDLRMAAEEKQITLRLELADGVPPGRGDSVRLDQALHHVIDNAIKFSPEQGVVVIKVDRDADCARVSVSDTGCGISRDRLDGIFEKFAQEADGMSAVADGRLGIGLYILREIVRRHGGKIDVESVEGEGSTFSFTVPLWDGDARPVMEGVLAEDAVLR